MNRISLFVLLFTVVTVLSCSEKAGQGTVAPSQKGAMEYAKCLVIQKCDDYSMVTIIDPWDTLKIRDRYILVDRSKMVPDDLPRGTVIKVPVRKAAVYTSVHSSIMEQLGVMEAISGVCEPQYITSDAVRNRVKSGLISDLGPSTAPNVEKIIDLDVEVIIASPFENSGYGAAEKIRVPIIEAADYMENHPLGRTEWVKFYGLLFGRETVADSLYQAVRNNYNRLKEMASSVSERPTLLLEKKYGGAWGVPGGGSYIGTMHSDAGADYLFSDYDGSDSRTLAYETVFNNACDADFWLFKYNAADLSYESLKEEYEPYADFKAFKERRIYVCNTADCSYYDDITLHPDLILNDFIYIYHPEILPGYSLKYYRPLE